MEIPAIARRALPLAATQGLAHAVWRSPAEGAMAGSRFRAVIALDPPRRRQVFGDADPAPFFALERFDADEPGRADAIAADILIEGETARFRDGAAFRPAPATQAQSRFAQALADAPETRLRAGSAPAPAPVQTGEAAYRALVEKAGAAIQEGRFLKAVTSRAEARPLPGGHDLLEIFAALCRLHPRAFVTLAAMPGQGAWIVATPETLLSVETGMVRTMALAGTQWRAAGSTPEEGEEGQDDLAAVTWPDKIIEEQALVARYIRDAFRDLGFAGLEEIGPRTVRAGALYHLCSRFSAPVGAEDAARLDALLGALHPTSAVCGMPKPSALAFLRAEEGYDRGYYTGFLGPVGFEGRTDLMVNLRSAQAIENTLYLHVGGGIVAGSDPAVEWAETVAKTRTIGAAL